MREEPPENVTLSQVWAQLPLLYKLIWFLIAAGFLWQMAPEALHDKFRDPPKPPPYRTPRPSYEEPRHRVYYYPVTNAAPVAPAIPPPAFRRLDTPPKPGEPSK